MMKDVQEARSRVLDEHEQDVHNSCHNGRDADWWREKAEQILADAKTLVAHLDAKPAKLWVVSAGSYSDETIETACSTKERADATAKLWGNDGNVYEVALDDPEFDAELGGLKRWLVRFSENGHFRGAEETNRSDWRHQEWCCASDRDDDELAGYWLIALGKDKAEAAEKARTVRVWRWESTDPNRPSVDFYTEQQQDPKVTIAGGYAPPMKAVRLVQGEGAQR